MWAVVVKDQGENRVRGDDGKLHATQRTKFKVCLMADDGGVRFSSWARFKTVATAQRWTEDEFGSPLTWHGYPDFGGFTPLSVRQDLIKAVASVRVSAQAIVPARKPLGC
jgi:hypothetical protein